MEAAHGWVDIRFVKFKVEDLKSQIFIFLLQLSKFFGESVGLLLSLLSGDSCAFAIFDETVLRLREDTAHLDQSLDRDNVEVNHEEANLQGLWIKLINIGGDGLGVLSWRAKKGKDVNKLRHYK